MKSKQLTLPGFSFKRGYTSKAHGGDLNTGKRKTARPFDPKQALHVVLRSSAAKSEKSFLNPTYCNRIETLTKNLAQKWGIKVYRYANVGNHLHLLVRASSRQLWQRFLKELTGAIAIMITNAKKGDALIKNKSGRGFWDHLTFTRIVNFGKDFMSVSDYLVKNLFEAAGVPMKKLLAQGYRIGTIECAAIEGD